tara:strand:+ start:1816 stop:3012 length:1197 start_codon:yes stop_codon:yes gene_type:complete
MSDVVYEKALKWINNNDGFMNSALERRADENGIYGLYAKEPIQANSILCRIPNKLIIFDTLHKSPDSWGRKLKLTYTILCEKKNREEYLEKKSRGEDVEEPFFSPALDLMTTIEEYRTFHPYFMDESEYNLLCNYSPIFKLIRSGQEESIKNSIKLINEYDTRFSDQEITEVCMINNTRTWLGMYVPVMCMFNHSIRDGVINETNDTSSTVRSKIEYQPGQQVYISYGNKDMLVLALEYGFYDKSDYNIVLPLILTYTGMLPLNFAVARILSEKGMKLVISDDSKRITAGIEDMSKLQRMKKLVCFSDEGISADLFDFFQTFAIETFDELLQGKGKLKKSYELLEEHLNGMIGGDFQIDRSEPRSEAFEMLISCMTDRLQILKDCREWVREQLQNLQE